MLEPAVKRAYHNLRNSASDSHVAGKALQQGGSLIRHAARAPVALRLVAVCDGGRDAHAHFDGRHKGDLAHAPAHARVLPPGPDRDGAVVAALVEAAEEALQQGQPTTLYSILLHDL